MPCQVKHSTTEILGPTPAEGTAHMLSFLATRMFGRPAVPAQGTARPDPNATKVQRWISYVPQKGGMGIELYGGWADVHHLADAAAEDRWDLWGLTPQTITHMLCQDEGQLLEFSGNMVRLAPPPPRPRLTNGPTNLEPGPPHRPSSEAKDMATNEPEEPHRQRHTKPRGVRRHIEPSWKKHTTNLEHPKGTPSDKAEIDDGYEKAPGVEAWAPPPPPLRRPEYPGPRPDAKRSRKHHHRILSASSKAAALAPRNFVPDSLLQTTSGSRTPLRMWSRSRRS